MKSFDIIMFALPRWDGLYSSTAFSLAKEFSKTNRVFYIDNPFTLKDLIFNFTDTKIQRRKKALILGKCVEKYPIENNKNLIAVTPKATFPVNWVNYLPLYNFLSRINDRIVLSSLKRIIKVHNIQNYIFFNIFNPFYLLDIHKKISPSPILYIYYSVDDISQAVYLKKHGPRLEEKIIQLVDYTLVTSKELLKLKGKFTNRVYYLPNAADTELFNEAALNKFNKPKELQNIDGNKKIVGYTGNIDDRIDFKLLRECALTYTDIVFVLIGPKTRNDLIVKYLSDLPNFIFTGTKNLSELPSYLQYFDCAIIPFVSNTFTKSIYPLKINEYLATGTPVVTTNFSENILDFHNVVYISDTPSHFTMSIQKAIDENTPDMREKRIAIAEKNSWNYRIEDFWRIAQSYNASLRKENKVY